MSTTHKHQTNKSESVSRSSNIHRGLAHLDVIETNEDMQRGNEAKLQMKNKPERAGEVPQRP